MDFGSVSSVSFAGSEKGGDMMLSDDSEVCSAWSAIRSERLEKQMTETNDENDNHDDNDHKDDDDDDDDDDDVGEGKSQHEEEENVLDVSSMMSSPPQTPSPKKSSSCPTPHQVRSRSIPLPRAIKAFVPPALAVNHLILSSKVLYFDSCTYRAAMFMKHKKHGCLSLFPFFSFLVSYTKTTAGRTVSVLS
jgi:hypothetical protein